jgi:glyoxylase I family protein
MEMTGIYHININCTNFDRSLEFYKMLGFKEVVDFGVGSGRHVELSMNLPPGATARGKLLQFGDDPHTCHIDLLEWHSANPKKPPYQRLDNTGICRVCFYSRNIHKDYEELKNKGIKFYSEPQLFKHSAGNSLIVCFEDPDGTVLELVQYQKP